jgi:hypothetical protein
VTAAAVDAAKARLAVGWPLLILAIAFYAPATGLVHLVLIAAGLWFLSRPHSTAAPARTPKSSKPAASQRPRDTEGRWIK